MFSNRSFVTVLSELWENLKLKPELEELKKGASQSLEIDDFTVTLALNSDASGLDLQCEIGTLAQEKQSLREQIELILKINLACAASHRVTTNLKKGTGELQILSYYKFDEKNLDYLKESLNDLVSAASVYQQVLGSNLSELKSKAAGTARTSEDLHYFAP